MYQPSLPERLAWQVYAWVLRLATPLYLWRVWSRGREEPGYRQHWWRRLGGYDQAYRQVWAQHQVGEAGVFGPVVWVHAVSLGESRAAAPLVAALREVLPGMRLLLTHGTATGMAAGATLLNASQGDVQTWLPYDTPGAVRRFLRLHRPSVGILMETEVWPVLQREAERAGVPMVLANARLSDKSLRQGQRLTWLMRPAVWRMAAVLTQSEEDARRVLLMKHGRQPVADDTVHVCGNVKFDMTPGERMLAQGRQWRTAAGARGVVLAASTREGEEAPLLAAWKAQMAAPQLTGQTVPRLWIVPRHPQRFDEVAQLVTDAGLSLSRRSAWTSQMPDDTALLADVWLGDTMGEMPAYYAASDVALLGGSFAPLGGQNLIEAAACGSPVMMGPSTFNFAQAAEWSEAAGCAWRVSDWADALRKAWQVCAEADTDRQMLRQKCLDFSRAHRGAAQRMADAIKPLMLPRRAAG